MAGHHKAGNLGDSVFLKERGTESWGVLSLLIYMHIQTFFTFFPKAHYRGWQRHDVAFRFPIPLWESDVPNFCLVVEIFEGPKRFGFYFHVLRVRRVTSCNSPKRKPGSFQSFQILYLTLRFPVNTKGTEKTQGFPQHLHFERGVALSEKAQPPAVPK